MISKLRERDLAPISLCSVGRPSILTSQVCGESPITASPEHQGEKPLGFLRLLICIVTAIPVHALTHSEIYTVLYRVLIHKPKSLLWSGPLPDENTSCSSLVQNKGLSHGQNELPVLDRPDCSMGKAYGDGQNTQYLFPRSLLWSECDISLPAKRIWSVRLLRFGGLLKLD